MESINERSTMYLTAKFYNKDGQLTVPSAIAYTVRDAETGVEVRASTPVVPASTVEIALDATDNTLQDQTHVSERRQVTLVANFGANDLMVEKYEYEVRNVQGYTE